MLTFFKGQQIIVAFISKMDKKITKIGRKVERFLCKAKDKI